MSDKASKKLPTMKKTCEELSTEQQHQHKARKSWSVYPSRSATANINEPRCAGDYVKKPQRTSKSVELRNRLEEPFHLNDDICQCPNKAICANENYFGRATLFIAGDEITKESIGRRIWWMTSARLAFITKRYEDARKSVIKAVETGVPLVTSERYLLWYIYKTLMNRLRHALSQPFDHLETTLSDVDKRKITFDYRAQIKHELRELAFEVYNMVHTRLYPYAQDEESKVFYLRIKGDIVTYIFYFYDERTQFDMLGNGEMFYESAIFICRKSLSPFHFERLVTMFNYAVYSKEILQKCEFAKKLLKVAIDSASLAMPCAVSFCGRTENMLNQMKDYYACLLEDRIEFARDDDDDVP